MRTFQSPTLSELLKEIKCQDDDMKVVNCCDFGDRSGTIQVTPVTGISFGHVRESGYSTSGFKILKEEDEIQDTDIRVVILNHHNSNDMDCALTITDLVQLIESLDEGLNIPVTFATDYGDHFNTIQANPCILREITDIAIKESCYSDSGWAVIDEDAEREEFGEIDDDDEVERYLSLS